MEKAGYLVDFEQKSWNKEDDNVPSSHFFHEDIQREEERIKWEKEVEEEDREREKRREERILLNQIISETQKGREKALQLQEQRKRKIELRKMQVKQRAEAQKEKQETQKQQQQNENKVVMENTKKRLVLKSKT